MMTWLRCALCLCASVALLSASRCTRKGQIASASLADRIDHYVTVPGNVDKIRAPRLFHLHPSQPNFHDTLVFTREPISFPDDSTLAVNLDVNVSGRVRRMTMADIEREVQWNAGAALGDLEEEYDAKPVIVADRVELEDRPGVVWRLAQSGSRHADADVVTDLQLLREASGSAHLEGRRIRLRGIPVAEVSRHRFLWVDASEPVLVVRVDERPASRLQVEISEGSTISLNGVVQEVGNHSQAISHWRLSARERKLLGSSKYYIEAHRLRVTGRGPSRRRPERPRDAPL